MKSKCFRNNINFLKAIAVITIILSYISTHSTNLTTAQTRDLVQMATTTQTKTQESVKVVLTKIGGALKDTKATDKAKVELLKEGVKSFKKLKKAEAAFNDSAQLLFEYLVALVGSLKRTDYNLNWLLKKCAVKRSTGYRRAKELAQKIEDSGLKNEEYIEKLERDIDNGVAVFKKEKLKLKKQIAFKMDENVEQFIDSEIAKHEVEREEKREKTEKDKERKEAIKVENITDLAETIKALKKKVGKDKNALVMVKKAENLMIKALNTFEAGIEFDTETPKTDEYKS